MGITVAKQTSSYGMCRTSWRHFTSTGSKHDATVLTDSQDVPQTLLKEIRYIIGNKGHVLM